jgi:hypothetical protein
MLTGGVIAYPTLQASLAPPDAASLEFSVTLVPPQNETAFQPTVAVLLPTLPAEPTLGSSSQAEGEAVQLLGARHKLRAKP